MPGRTTGGGDGGRRREDGSRRRPCAVLLSLSPLPSHPPPFCPCRHALIQSASSCPPRPRAVRHALVPSATLRSSSPRPRPVRHASSCPPRPCSDRHASSRPQRLVPSARLLSLPPRPDPARFVLPSLPLSLDCRPVKSPRAVAGSNFVAPCLPCYAPVLRLPCYAPAQRLPCHSPCRLVSCARRLLFRSALSVPRAACCAAAVCRAARRLMRFPLGDCRVAPAIRHLPSPAPAPSPSPALACCRPHPRSRWLSRSRSLARGWVCAGLALALVCSLPLAPARSR